LGLSATAIARNAVWQDEVKFWNDVVSKSPNKARAHMGLGEALIRRSSFVPEDNNLLEGMMLMKEGSDKQIITAVNAFKESIRLKPKSLGAHINMAKALILLKNYDEAMISLATATELQPKNSMPYVMRGEIFEARKEFARASQEYHEAIKVEPLFHVPHLKLANIYAKEGNVQAAIKELELVMQIYPDEKVRNKLDELRNR
jgi:tetratricopeptide (TPR) repeat protein